MGCGCGKGSSCEPKKEKKTVKTKKTEKSKK